LISAAFCFHDWLFLLIKTTKTTHFQKECAVLDCSISTASYTLDLPLINEITNRTKNIKNRIFAILAAPAAIPPKPNIPATMARIIKVTVQRNIIIVF